ncbi:extracellular solute-binding protein [Micromonospora sp. NPDC023644]|uniref:extracellular solute-binding protein n=1 Tax=Micromonospora sp. NPDC023644 TaxID=3154321 RepID=UPI0033F7C10D
MPPSVDPAPGRRDGRGGRWLPFWLGNLSGLLVATLLFVLLPVIDGPEDLEPGELVIISGRDDSVGGQRQALIDLWNASHPRNQARIVSLSEAADGQHAEMVNRAQDDTDIDVFNLDVTWTAEFADKNLLRPIDESRLVDRPDEVFLKNPLSTCRYEGDLWALPFNTDAGLLFHRTDLGLQPPFEWPEIESESARLLAAKVPGLEAGYTSQLADYEGLTVNTLEALWAADGELRVDEQGHVSVDRDRFADALRSLTPAGAGDPAAGPSVVSPKALTQNEARSRESFRAGEVAFMRNWPVAYRQLTDTDATTAPSTPSAATVRFGVETLPGPSVLGGQNLAVARRSQQPRAAQALIAFLTGEQSQRMLFERGGFAATRDVVYSEAAIKAKYPYVDKLRKAVDTARLRPVSPHYVHFSRVLRGYVRTALTGGTLPSDLDQRLSEALRGATPTAPAQD